MANNQAPAKKAAPKKTPLAAKRTPNDSISEDEMDVDVDEDSSPAKPRQPADDGIATPTKGPAKSASEMYQKLSQLEHVLKRPDTYIGSVEAVTQPMWVYDSTSQMMVHRYALFP